jgi:hypothetical protein
MSDWADYWVLAADDDPLPNIGSGFRRVQVQVKRGKVHVRTRDKLYSDTLTPKEWDLLPHIQAGDHTLTGLLAALRAYQPPKPCKADGTCEVPFGHEGKSA